MFAKMDQLGVTLPRVRIMRIDYAETMRYNFILSFI